LEEYNVNKFIKTVVSGALAVTLFGGGMVFASSTGLTDTGWWSNVAQWANDRGLMTGTGNGIFGGDESLTRGQLAQVVKNLAGSGAITINNSAAVTNNIGDFKDSGWWSASAKWAKDHGLMNGMGDGTFGGDQSVTRGQMAQVLKNLAGSGAITINNSAAVTNNSGSQQTATGSGSINHPTTVTNNSGSEQTATGSGSINHPTTVSTNSGPDQTTTSSKGDGIISFEKYQQTQIGMTYPQVANLIGKDGLVQSTNPQETVYQWSDGKGGLLVVYTDNADWNKSIAKVTMKQETNLNWETPPANLPAQNTSVTLDQFNRIQMGMSQQEVVSIVGMYQSEEVYKGNTTFNWRNLNSLLVVFDSTGKVIEKIQGGMDTHHINPKFVTLSTYNAIKTGMTYPQVVGLFGGDNGILLIQSALDPNAGSLYTWKSYDGNEISVLFGLDGKVSRITNAFFN
jgi:hypothetical protein